MKKGWIIALCVLLVLGAGAGYGYYRLHGAAQEAEQTQQALYEQYQAMLQNAEQTTLTVTEKQFSKMEFVVGEYHSDIIDSEERLVIL